MDVEAAVAPAPLASAKSRMSDTGSPRGRLQAVKSLHLELSTDYLLWSTATSTKTRGAIVACGLIEDRELDNSARFGEHLDNLIVTQRVNRAEVNLFLSWPEAFFRCFSVPIVPENELKQVIFWEANKVFPFRLEDALCDCRVIATINVGGVKKQQVQVAAVLTEKIMPVFNLIKERGLEIRRITFSSLAWESILPELSKSRVIPEQANLAIARLSGNIVSVQFLYQGHLEFTRESPLESNELSLEAAFSPDLESTAASQGGPNQIGRIISDSLDYYYEQFPQRVVEGIALLFPEGAQSDLENLVNRTLGLKTFPINAHGIDSSLSTELPSYILLPSTLRYKVGGRTLNLLPTAYRGKEEKRRRARFTIYLSGFMLLIMCLASVFIYRNLRLSEIQKKELSETLSYLKESSVYQRVLTLSGMERTLSLQLAGFATGSTEPISFLKAISQLTPKEICLTNMNFQGAKGSADDPRVYLASLTGFVFGHQGYHELSLATYVKTLEKIRGMGKVKLASQQVTISNSGRFLNFTIELEMR